MPNFRPFQGTITMISDFQTTGSGELSGCYKLITVDNGNENIVNFVVSPSTYFVDHVTVALGDRVTGFYDADAPALLIYPPQLQAIVMSKDIPFQNVKVDFFNSQLLSKDGQLKLNLSEYTQIRLPNNQVFTQYPGNRNLIVTYGPTTRSIPAQTTPFKIIVMCT